MHRAARERHPLAWLSDRLAPCRGKSDHLAAVATLATRSRSVRHTVWQGAIWGLGHTITLYLVCAFVLFLKTTMPARLALGLEAAVGVMLVILGVDVIRRLLNERIHFHSNRHADGTIRLYAYSDPGHGAHEPWLYGDPPVCAFPMRVLLVGLMHGMAGSAALIVLTLQTVSSPLLGLVYVALFGLGSIARYGAALGGDRDSPALFRSYGHVAAERAAPAHRHDDARYRSPSVL